MKLELALGAALVLAATGAALDPAAGGQSPSAEERARLERWPYSLALPDLPRDEIVFPAVEGYEVLKGDFHIHTYYSDGLVAPDVRVVEAWRDGLDVIAITDHAEYLDVAIPYDRERSYGRALPVARQLGLMVVRGAELTQLSARPKPPKPSDFVVSFVKDEWRFQTDFDTALAAAHEQGAAIVWAHPGPEWLPIAESLVARGWLDGIELRNGVVQGRSGTRPTNGVWLWPQVMDWCLEHDLAVFASSDAHWPIDFMVPKARGARREMTLLLARTRDLEGVREAIRARRTLACFGGMIWGRERWLKGLVEQSLLLRVPPASGIPSRQRHSLRVENRSSFEFRIAFATRGAGAPPTRDYAIAGGTATMVPLEAPPAGATAVDLDLTVTNLFHGADRPLRWTPRVAVDR